MAEIVKTTAELNVSDYKMPEDSSDLFANLSIFSKNLVLKDTKVFESEETDISRWFGNMMLKYYRGQLKKEDVEHVLRFVSEYNRKMADILGYSNSTDNNLFPNETNKSIARLKVFGLYKTQNIKDSIAYNILVNKIYSNCKEKGKSKEEFLNAIDLTNVNSIINQELTHLINQYSPGITEINFNKPTSMLTGLILNDDAIKNIFNCVLLKEFFEIYQSDKGEIHTSEKYNASELEKSIVNNGSSICAFDFAIKPTTTSDLKRIIVVYKELNPLYRNILKSDLTEVAFEIRTHGPDKAHLNYIAIPSEANTTTVSSFSMTGFQDLNIDKSLTSSFLNCPRYYSMVSNNYFNTIEWASEVISTNKLFCYQYGNPFTARNAAESEIMLYYYGDNYISNSFGKYKYQQKEIQQFLYNYQTCRDAYFHTLRNDAFITDEKYRVYERFFLICWAIQNTIDERADNMADIDAYDYDDVVNFFKSYGMYDIAATINLDNYEQSEEVAKRLLKRYTELVSKKGSRAIYDVLAEIFSVNSKVLKFYGVYLTGDQLKQIPDDSDNLYEGLKNAASVNLSQFKDGQDDILWKVDSDDLVGKNTTFVPTKYLKVSYDHEISVEYVLLRCLIGLVDNKTISGDVDTNIPGKADVNETNQTNLNQTFKQAITNLKQLFVQYCVKSIQEVQPEAEISNFKFLQYSFNETKLIGKNPKYSNEYWHKEINRLKNLTNEKLYNTKDSFNWASITTKIVDEFFDGLTYINDTNFKFKDFAKKILKLPYFLFGDKPYRLTIKENKTGKPVDIKVSDLPNEYIKILWNLFDKAFTPSSTPFNNASTSLTPTVLLQQLVELLEALIADLKDTNDDTNILTNIGMSVGVKNDDNTALLVKAVEYFISYTTKMLPFSFTLKIDNNSDCVLISDSVNISVDTELVDQLYYDEELSVEESRALNSK